MTLIGTVVYNRVIVTRRELMKRISVRKGNVTFCILKKKDLETKVSCGVFSCRSAVQSRTRTSL